MAPAIDTSVSPQVSAPPVHMLGGAAAWAVALVGFAAAAGWISFSQKLGDTIDTQSVAVLALLFYGLVYLPIILIAAIMGIVCGVKVFRGGRHPAKWLLGSAGLGAAGLTLTVLYAALNGGLSVGEGSHTGGGLLMLGAALTLLATAAQELLLRGWLQPLLGRLTGRTLPAIAIAALASAALQLVGGTFSWLPFLNLTLAGALFGLLANLSGGMAAPIAAHFAWNVLEDLGLGLMPNPGTGTFGAVRDFDLLGATLWGGSEAGLAGGVGMTIVLAALLLPTLTRKAVT
ncbi:MAG: CPBP family intramembrane glutamic endopeptidase [Novosphingobium sp.]